MKYRKLPVVIEAIQFQGSTSDAIAIRDWMAGREYAKPQVRTADITQMKIATLEGVMTASPGDYIIKGVNGEFYPCREDIFRLTYESVEDAGE